MSVEHISCVIISFLLHNWRKLSLQYAILPPTICHKWYSKQPFDLVNIVLVLYASTRYFISSVRSFNSHPDLLLIHHPPNTHFFRSHLSSTLDFHFLSHYSYIKAIMLYKSNHWTRCAGCAGFMDASWVQMGITNDDLGTSWALPGDNLGMTWG